MNARRIIGLSVETRHGKHLGKVIDVDIDPENHVVSKYAVSSAPLVRQFLTDVAELYVDPSQVLSITSKKMVVVDLSEGETVDAYEELSEDSGGGLKERKTAQSISQRGTEC